MRCKTLVGMVCKELEEKECNLDICEVIDVEVKDDDSRYLEILVIEKGEELGDLEIDG